MNNMMIIIVAIGISIIALQAEIVHPAVEKAMAMETNTPEPLEGDTNTSEEALEEK